jgi:hypothetical protein
MQPTDTSAYPINQFAPAGQAGVPVSPDQLYDDKPYEYVYQPPNGALTADQFLNPDNLTIQTDADFYAFGYYIAFATGNFQVQFIDPTGYQLMSGMINSAAISTTSSDPTVFSPTHPFPAGSKIQIIIQDLSGAANTIQIVFKGVKRFKIAQ